MMFGYRTHAVLHRGLGNRESKYRPPRSIEFFFGDDDEMVGQMGDVFGSKLPGLFNLHR